MVTMAVKFTSKACAPYLARPPLSRNVSFSKNPNVALLTTRTYRTSPNRTCHGNEELLRPSVAPGKKNTKNPYIHCQL